MLERFYPNIWVESTYIIPFKEYYDKGYRNVIFDIDNTLVEHGAPADARAIELLKGLIDMGYGVFFLSNNKEPRVKMFNDAIGAKYIYNAWKPNPKSYIKAMDILGGTESDTMFVGDQIFTDIWGANRAGLYSILVNPIHPKEEIQIVLKRKLERIVLFFYKRRLAKGKK